MGDKIESVNGNKIIHLEDAQNPKTPKPQNPSLEKSKFKLIFIQSEMI